MQPSDHGLRGVGARLRDYRDIPIPVFVHLPECSCRTFFPSSDPLLPGRDRAQKKRERVARPWHRTGRNFPAVRLHGSESDLRGEEEGEVREVDAREDGLDAETQLEEHLVPLDLGREERRSFAALREQNQKEKEKNQQRAQSMRAFDARILLSLLIRYGVMR